MCCGMLTKGARHAGEMLIEEFLVPTGVPQRRRASKLGWTPAKLNELVKGKRAITADSALDLPRPSALRRSSG